MARVLSLETSGKIGSVAIHQDSELIVTTEFHVSQSHASQLAPMIQQVLALAGMRPDSLDVIAVSAGPGSYTGLRIGVSTAKGLCYANSIPLIAVNTLDLLAFQMQNYITKSMYLCPMIDARRMEVYCKVLDGELREIMPMQPMIIDINAFEHLLFANEICFFGDGAAKCNEVLQHKNAKFVTGIYPKAASLGFMATRKFHENNVEDLVSFEPAYLKQFQIKTALR